MAQTLAHIRPPAVAGMFYPGTKSEIHRQVAGFLAAVKEVPGPAPKALIAPHAGYVYSGPIAASAYALLAPLRGRVSRVVLIGPSHRVAFRGLALCRAAAYALPGLEIPIDLAGVATLLDLPFVGYLDQAHAQEHSLEVHLPFLAETGRAGDPDRDQHGFVALPGLRERPADRRPDGRRHRAAR